METGLEEGRSRCTWNNKQALSYRQRMTLAWAGHNSRNGEVKGEVFLGRSYKMWGRAGQ